MTADHLAGLAVECALKALLIGVGGVLPSATGIQKPFAKHGTALWGEAVAHLQGHSATSYFAPVLLTNPFGDWDIADRYEDGVRAHGGASISPAEASALLAVGHALVAQLQGATTDGYAMGL